MRLNLFAMILIVSMMCTTVHAQDEKILWPQSSDWIEQGVVIKPDTQAVLKDHQGFVIQPQHNGVTTDPALPKANYVVRWELPMFGLDIHALQVQAKLMKSNLHQNNQLYLVNGGGRWLIGSNDDDWKAQPYMATAWPLDHSQPLYLQWEFSKPELGAVWRTQLLDVKVTAADSSGLKDNFLKPLAGGLPALVDPDTVQPWQSKLTVKDGMMFKDEEPFFPIGFVFGTKDRELAQAKAMGANAVHFEVGWRDCPTPGMIKPQQFTHLTQTLDRAAKWDMASFVILTGHYVPGWFAIAHKDANAYSMGSDGKKTGSWFPYSLHYPPFRTAIADFWKSAAPAIASHPNVMGINFWNEPCYGGTWNKGKQYGDYAVWSIANYRDYLKEKYQTLSQLNKAHDQQYASFDVVMPPKSPGEMSPTAWLDWMTFGQKAFADFFQWERSVIREVAPKIALVNKKQTNPWDNSTASSGTNWHLMGLSEDIYGLNTYGGSEAGYRDRLDAARSYAHGKPVVVFETNAMPANAKSRTPDRIELQLWSQILGGADGMFIFAMIPNGEHGILGDRAADDDDRAAYARFVKLISTHQRELASPHVKARVAVLYSTTAAMQYTQDIVPRYVLGAFRLLRDNHYQVDILPQERCDLANLQDYELLVLPTRSILMPDQEVAIAQWVAKGGKILAFADSLAKDWKMQAQTPPRFLGLDTRKPPIGDRDRQTISVVDDSLQALITEEISISGVELVSNVKEPGNLLPGQGIDASQKGKVLAYNSDSYPAIIETIPGRVIYCAFDSVSHLPMRHLVEGLVRQNLGLDQHVRLTENHMACPGVLTSLREDYKDPSIRYLLVMNTHSRNHQVSLEANSSWQVLSDELGAITVINQATSSVVLDVPQRSVGLLKLRRSN